jgi:hypothetical protein
MLTTTMLKDLDGKKKEDRSMYKGTILGVLVVAGIIVGVFLSDFKTNETETKPNEETEAVTVSQTNIDWDVVEKVIGKQGEMKPGNVFRIGLPRTDLNVTVDDVQIHPGLALGSWLAFKQTNNGVMVMGDLVLKEAEVNDVISQLIKGNIEVTALHNHLLGESPDIMYMHIQGHGDPIELSKTLRTGLDQSDTPLNNQKRSSENPTITLNVDKLNQLFGKEGKVSSGLYKISFPRAEQITMNGMEIPPSMGTATAINFQPTGKGKAAVTGDFVLAAEEVNPVIRTLRKHDIEVEALHNHMLTEEPRLFFVHFWATDDAEKLAKGLKKAVDKTNIKTK